MKTRSAQTTGFVHFLFWRHFQQAAGRSRPAEGGRGRRRRAILFTGFLLAGGSSLSGQVVERNLPPPVAKEPATVAPLVPPPAKPAEDDDRPIAGPLRTIVFLNTGDPLAVQPAGGVEVSRVARLDNPRAIGRLKPFIGRTLSRRLVAEIQTEVTRYYRELGFPFVALSLPEQEVTSGVLQIRVLEYRAGKLHVEGAAGRAAGFLRDRIRFAPGDPVSAPLLTEDLDWLNRYPFRQLEARFSPGEKLGETDLHLVAQSARDWRVFTGYSNSGSPSTGRDRYFAGGMIGNLPGLPDSFVSYQVTGSRNATGDFRHPGYLSHGARLMVPTRPRQNLELTLNAVESNQEMEFFTVRQQTFEGTAGYRAALSSVAGWPGEVVGGVEARRQKRNLLFGGSSANQAAADTYQGFAGWSNDWSDRLGRSRVDLTLHFNPGGNSRALRAYTEGRVHDSRYAYLTLGYARAFTLPHSLVMTTEVSGQYAARALPTSVQLGLGGEGSVRGYSSDDGAYDRGIVVRNELRWPGLPALGALTKGRLHDTVVPFVFADLGHGEDLAAGRNRTLEAVGAGADYQLGETASARLNVACPLRANTGGRAGAWRVEFRLTLRR